LSEQRELEKLVEAKPELFTQSAGSGKANGKAAQNEAPRIRRFSEIPDLLAMEIRPIEYLVDGMISRKSLTLWAGVDGTAKTLLAQKMGLAVAGGYNFLGRQCRQATVLYLDYENPDFAVRERLELLSGTEKLEPNFKVWGTWLEQQPPPIGSEVLYQLAKEVRPLLIVDPFRYSHTAEENDSTEMMLVMQALRSYAAAGAAVVVLHHPAKTEGSTGRGSSAIRGAVDVAFLQELSDETDLITLKCVKNRFGERLTVTIRPDFDEGTFEVTDSPAFTRRRHEIDRLLEIITAEAGLSQNQVVAKAGMQRLKVQKLLKEHTGRLWRIEQGPRQSTLFYALVPKISESVGTTGTGHPVATGSVVPTPLGGNHSEPGRGILTGSREPVNADDDSAWEVM